MTKFIKVAITISNYSDNSITNQSIHQRVEKMTWLLLRTISPNFPENSLNTHQVAYLKAFNEYFPKEFCIVYKESVKKRNLPFVNVPICVRCLWRKHGHQYIYRYWSRKQTADIKAQQPISF